MSVINYAIEVVTNKSKSANLAYGFDGSTFRWITGRPGYDGGTDSYYGISVAARSPKSYWRFGESSGTTAVDEMGGVNLSYLNTFSLGNAGADGVNDSNTSVRFTEYGKLYASISSTYYTQAATGSFVIDAWVKRVDNSTVQKQIFNVITGASTSNFILRVLGSGDGHALSCYIRDTTGSQTITVTGGTITQNVWHYVVAVYNNKTLNLYLDGTLVGTGTNTNLNTLFYNTTLINNSSYAGSDFYLDELCFTEHDWYTGLTHKDWYNYLKGYPTWEDGSYNTHAWTEGWIIQDEIGDPARFIDISETGDYGTISGFEFGLRNDTPATGASPLWKWVRDNGIHFTNRVVNLYLIIDDRFYIIWSGVVENNPADDINYRFKCQDSFKKVHKMMPPKVVDRNTFPGSDDDSQGKSIPVSIGNVTYAKLQTVNDNTVLTNLVLSENLPGEMFSAEAAGAIYYDTALYTSPHLFLYTKGVNFAASALKDKYIYIAKGGGLADTDRLIKILDNAATDASFFTELYLESAFEFVSMDKFNDDYAYDPYYSEDNIEHWSFETTDIYGCQLSDQAIWATPSFTYITDIHQSSYWGYEHIDFYNNGVGSTQININIRYSPQTDALLDVRLGSPTGTLIGTLHLLYDPEHTNGVWYDKIKIKRQFGNDVTIYFVLRGSYRFEGASVLHFYSFNVGGLHPNDNTWWFSVIDMVSAHLVSDRAISEYVSDENNVPYLYVFNKDRQEMERVSNQILSLLPTQEGPSGHPEFALYSSNLQKSGDVRYFVPIGLSQWGVSVDKDIGLYLYGNPWVYLISGYIKVGENYRTKRINHNITKLFPYINIADRSTFNEVELRFPDQGGPTNTYQFAVRMAIPTEYLKQEMDTMYACMDMEIYSYRIAPSIDEVPIRLMIIYDVLDPYGNIIDLESTIDYSAVNVAYPMDQVPASSRIAFFTIPREYYANGGTNDFSNENIWGLAGEDASGEPVTMRSMLELPSEVWDAIKDGTSSRMLQARVIITSNGASAEQGSNFTLSVALKEACLIGEKTMNPINQDYYCRIKGELLTDGSDSSTVYRAFRLMLEEYDGLSPVNDIDYTNLPVVRDDWPVGRQLTDRKNSFEYIRELAKHSFVAVYPTRQGKRGLKAWRDDVDTVMFIDETKILRDSISRWEKTSVSDLYNDFRLWYNWSAASGNYLDSITLTATDQYYPVVGGVTAATAGFPGTTAMMDYPSDLQVWKTYVGGISPNSYTDAEIMWTFAHESFDIAAAIQPLPKQLSELPWYTNTYLFNNQTFVGASKADSPYKYLENLALWTTLQKDEVRFDLPITSENCVLELLDFVQLSDTIMTDSETRIGWITGIEFIPTKNIMRVTVLLNPSEIREDLVIKERGQLLNFNKYTEPGNEYTGIIADGQGRT